MLTQVLVTTTAEKAHSAALRENKGRVMFRLEVPMTKGLAKSVDVRSVRAGRDTQARDIRPGENWRQNVGGDLVVLVIRTEARPFELDILAERVTRTYQRLAVLGLRERRTKPEIFRNYVSCFS